MASTYREVGMGSTGADVKVLQQKLNEKGYALEEDGIFGVKTQAAVRDYQKKNGLLLDGIAGVQTWGSLLAAEKENEQTVQAAPVPSVSQATMDALGKLEQGYKPSEEVEILAAEKESILSKKPENYVSGFDAQIRDLYDQIAGRENFS